MKFYSELLDKFYDTPEECQKADNEQRAALKKKQEEREKAIAEQKEKLKKLAEESSKKLKAQEAKEKEIIAAQEVVDEAMKNYTNLYNTFVEEYGFAPRGVRGSHFMTNIPGVNSFPEAAKLFTDILFRPPWFSNDED